MNHFEAYLIVSTRVEDSKVLGIKKYLIKRKMASGISNALDGFSLVCVLTYLHSKSGFLQMTLKINLK